MRDYSLIKVMEGHEGRVMCAAALPLAATTQPPASPLHRLLSQAAALALHSRSSGVAPPVPCRRCADASDDGKYFATSAMDRTWKLWGR